MKTVKTVKSNMYDLRKDHYPLTFYKEVDGESDREYVIGEGDALSELVKDINAPDWLKFVIETLNDYLKDLIYEISKKSHNDLKDIWERLDRIENKTE